MAESIVTNSPQGPSESLVELQDVLQKEIPMCGQMGISVHAHGSGGLIMGLPLERNRNHQQTAFAGSLNALCTIAGWGTVFLLLKQLGHDGNIVIRRSTIRYHEPVDTDVILARCHVVDSDARDYFAEMLSEKGQAKLDLTVEIEGVERAAVVFHGSYVVFVANIHQS